MTAGAIQLNPAGYRCLTAAGAMVLCCEIPCEGFPDSVTEYADDFGGDLSGWSSVGDGYATASGLLEVTHGAFSEFPEALIKYFKCNGDLADFEADIEADLQAGDDTNDGDRTHVIIMGIRGNGSGSARRYAIGIQQRLDVGPPLGNYEYRFLAYYDTTVVALTSWTAMPGGGIARITIEPEGTPGTWTCQYYIDGSLLLTQDTTGLDEALQEPCEFAVGYFYGGSSLADILDPPPSGFLYATSDYFAATISCGAEQLNFMNFLGWLDESGG